MAKHYTNKQDKKAHKQRRNERKQKRQIWAVL